MSVKSVLVQVKTLLETKTEFKQRVSVWDYSILDLAIPHALVLRPGSVTQAMEAYGNQWLRQVSAIIEAYAFYEPATSTNSINRLLDVIDLIDTLLIENYHLGLTVDTVRSAQISGIGVADIISRDTSGNKWFHVTITLAVTEPEVGSGSAQ